VKRLPLQHQPLSERRLYKIESGLLEGRSEKASFALQPLSERRLYKIESGLLVAF